MTKTGPPYHRSEADYALDAALKRIYARYGADIAAFFRDVDRDRKARDAARDLELRKRYGLA